MKVYLVRHGKTEYNLVNKIQGWHDSPLLKDDDSPEKAAKLLSGIKFDYICSSDLKRAITTREKIVKILGLIDENNIESSFREVNFGKFEGLELNYVIENYKSIWDKYKLQIEDYDPSVDIEGFESVKKVRERFYKRFNELKEKFGDNANILVVTHGGAINIVTNKKGELKEYPRIPENGSVTVLEV